jgi:predicted Zn-dependent protease
MDLLLMPDQMMLQIHESIGHPLELDRILGDERNYAGTSFVTLDMFGTYRYGSDLLNVSFDPTHDEEFASYAFDDDGAVAQKTLLIERGILQRPLGGELSQQRARVAGVANTRACSWNRPPIDRMANLNVEPGDTPLADMIAATERGILMKTNLSWSIDDSRNKFQFGCEWGQLIENGKLTRVVKNPNYRGISATFWRSLKMVGDPPPSTCSARRVAARVNRTRQYGLAMHRLPAYSATCTFLAEKSNGSEFSGNGARDRWRIAGPAKPIPLRSPPRIPTSFASMAGASASPAACASPAFRST